MRTRQRRRRRRAGDILQHGPLKYLHTPEFADKLSPPESRDMYLYYAIFLRFISDLLRDCCKNIRSYLH